MEYYLAIKKNEIVPFVTTWMDLEGTMQSETSPKQINITWIHLHVESKEQNQQQQQKETGSQMQRIDWWLPEGSRLGAGELGRKVKGLRSTDWQLQNSHGV